VVFDAVALGDGEIVLERRVRLVEGVLELVPLEDVVLGARSLHVAELGIHGPAHGPESAGLPLDPEDDMLFVPGVVDPSEHPLREPAAVGRDLHCLDYTIAWMAKLRKFLTSPFSFLFTSTSIEEQVIAYLTREHARGRRASEILEDRYIKNRLTPQQQARLLDRAEVVHALGEQDVDSARQSLSGNLS
jgi:hypothetical protein